MIKFMKVNYNGIAQRYIHNKNFESEHQTDKLDMSKGKLLNAYEYAKTLKIDDDVPCINIINNIIETQTILYDNVYVNSLVAVELDK